MQKYRNTLKLRLGQKKKEKQNLEQKQICQVKMENYRLFRHQMISWNSRPVSLIPRINIAFINNIGDELR